MAARRDGELVGAVRVIPRATLAEIRRIHGFDGNVPLRDDPGLGEASRLCVAPHFRGRGLFWVLGDHMVTVARDLRIRCLFGGATEALWPIWERFGFRYLGVSYPFASLNGMVHRLMTLDIERRCSDYVCAASIRQGPRK